MKREDFRKKIEPLIDALAKACAEAGPLPVLVVVQFEGGPERESGCFVACNIAVEQIPKWTETACRALNRRSS